MTREKQIAEIAGFCGAVWYRKSNSFTISFEDDIHKHSALIKLGWELSGRVPNDDEITCWSVQHVPDYLQDLNAIYEAEKHLSFDQWRDYVDIIIDNVANTDEIYNYKGYEAIHSTAQERAAALIEIINLYYE